MVVVERKKSEGWFPTDACLLKAVVAIAMLLCETFDQFTDCGDSVIVDAAAAKSNTWVTADLSQIGGSSQPR